MRNVIVSTYATLDGRADELPEWTIPYNGEAAAAYHGALLERAGGLLLGRRTYELFAQLWPARAGAVPYVDRINALPKYVATTGNAELPWAGSHRVADVARDVAELKRQPGGDLVVYGGLGFVRVLLDLGLVDEYRVLLHPTMLGCGRGVADEGSKRIDLDLVGTDVLPGGVVVLTYRP